MAIMNISVPQDVKDAFDLAFVGKNKSAILTNLMRKAIEDAELAVRRRRIFDEINADRHLRPAVTDAQIRRARVAGRK